MANPGRQATPYPRCRANVVARGLLPEGARRRRRRARVLPRADLPLRRARGAPTSPSVRIRAGPTTGLCRGSSMNAVLQTSAHTDIREIALDRIQPSATDAQKHRRESFDAAKLIELSESLRKE